MNTKFIKLRVGGQAVSKTTTYPIIFLLSTYFVPVTAVCTGEVMMSQ